MTSWAWEYFTKDGADKKTVSCKVCCVTLGPPVYFFDAVQICKGNGLEGKLAFHGTTSAMLNHLKHKHGLEQQTPKGVGTWLMMVFFFLNRRYERRVQRRTGVMYYGFTGFYCSQNRRYITPVLH